MKKVVVASVFVLLFGVSQVKAAGQLSLFAGYLNPGEVNLDSVRESLRFRGTSLYGARAEVDFLKVLGMEHSFAFSPRLLNNTLFPQEASDLRGFLYSGNLVVNVPLSRFVPYVTGGVGLVKPWGTGIRPFDATFAGNYGGGVKLNRLAGPVGLRFDVRGWRTADIANRGGINIFEATAAVTFTW
jgi:hypothetical protein